MLNRSNGLITLFIIIMAYAAAGGQQAVALKTDPIPMAARIVLSRAGELMQQKAYDRAIRTLTAFQQRGEPGQPDPKGYFHPMIYLMIGNCHLFRKELLEAEKALSQAVARDPELAEAWQNLARTYYERQEYTRAADCFETAYEKSNQANPDTLYFGALSWLGANQYEAAVDAFRRLFLGHPDRVTLRWKAHYAQALLAAEHPRRALPLIRNLAEQSSGEEKTRWRKILLYLFIRLDMRSEALAYATRLTRSECTRAIWWKAMAHVHLSDGCAEKALAALTIYGFLTPLSVEEKKLWADLSLEVDIPSRAAAGYHELLHRHPDESIVRNLVLAYRKLDHFQEALKALARYAPATRSPDLLMLKADTLYCLNRYTEAETVYRQVARAKTSLTGQAWLFAGYAAWQNEDWISSRHAFEKAAQDKHYRKAALLALRQIRPRQAE
jgi:tetratricopeptide (TPR) repeat protein